MPTLFELRRYPFSTAVVEGAPEEAGVYVLWEGDELTYIGTAGPGDMTIRSRLMEHLLGQDHCSCSPTHYSWRLARFPQVLEREFLGQYKAQRQDMPRCNKAGAR